ncbi:MAG: glycerophosphodiester phosphodiesterase [Rubrobacteraceae bacterium]
MRQKWILAVFVIGLLGLVAVIVLRKGATQEFRADWPVNLAHRGDSARAPENTLEAFRRAARAGAGGLELDVHLTRDRRVVVIHDDTLDRTTDGTGLVRDKTLAEIQRFDAGYRFTENGGYPYRGKGVRAPTLEKVFSEFPDLAVNVEIKEDQAGVEDAVLQVIREAGAEDRTLVASHRHAVIKRFREVSGGEIDTAGSVWETRVFFLLSKLRLESLLQPDYDALQVPVRYRGVKVLTPGFLEAAHDRGVRVDVWTVDEPDQMRRLLDLGVDVIMTNQPDTLQEVLEERRRD